MKTKQTMFGLLMALSSIISLQAQDNDEKPYLTKTFPMTGLTNVKAETSGGNLSVQGQTTGEARIEVYVRSSNWNDKLSDAEIKNRLKDYEITINKDASTLTATARSLNKMWNWKNGLSISFRIYAPANVTTNLQTSGGNIKLTNLNGRQNAETSGGNISIASLKGVADVETSGGNIEVENFDGTLDAQTSGGNIKLEESKGSLKIGTSGGNIRIARVEGGLQAETSGGNITADIVNLGKFLTLSTSGGNINIKMPMDKGMDLDLSGDKVNISMQNFKGSLKDDRVKGTLNGGGIPVRISTSGGNVRVN